MNDALGNSILNPTLESANINVSNVDLIPEPTTMLLMGFGLLGVLAVVIRQRRKAK